MIIQGLFTDDNLKNGIYCDLSNYSSDIANNHEHEITKCGTSVKLTHNNLRFVCGRGKIQTIELEEKVP